MNEVTTKEKIDDNKRRTRKQKKLSNWKEECM